MFLFYKLFFKNVSQYETNQECLDFVDICKEFNSNIINLRESQFEKELIYDITTKTAFVLVTTIHKNKDYVSEDKKTCYKIAAALISLLNIINTFLENNGSNEIQNAKNIDELYSSIFPCSIILIFIDFFLSNTSIFETLYKTKSNMEIKTEMEKSHFLFFKNLTKFTNNIRGYIHGELTKDIDGILKPEKELMFLTPFNGFFNKIGIEKTRNEELSTELKIIYIRCFSYINQTSLIYQHKYFNINPNQLTFEFIDPSLERERKNDIINRLSQARLKEKLNVQRELYTQQNNCYIIALDILLKDAKFIMKLYHTLHSKILITQYIINQLDIIKNDNHGSRKASSIIEKLILNDNENRIVKFSHEYNQNNIEKFLLEKNIAINNNPYPEIKEFVYVCHRFKEKCKVDTSLKDINLIIVTNNKYLTEMAKSIDLSTVKMSHFKL